MRILVLNIKATLEVFNKQISNYFTDTWYRDSKLEKLIDENTQSKEDTYVVIYKYNNQNVMIILEESDNEMELINIVYQDSKKSLSVPETNNILRKFEKDILSQTNLVYSIKSLIPE